jgi:outer membrane protein assembly factor BamB
MILDGSRLAIVAENYILCVSTEDGSKLWDWVAPKGEYPARLFNHYSQSAEAIYVSLDYYPGAVVKLAKSDGHEIWKTRNTMILDDIYKGVDFSDVHSGAVYYDGRVYIGSRYGASRIGNGVYKDGSMTCLDDATGQILWMKQVPRLDTNMNGHSYTPSEYGVTSAPIPFEGGIDVKAGYTMMRLDTAGNIVWRALIPDNGSISELPWTLRLYDDRLYAMNDPGGATRLHCLNPLTGEQYWSTLLTEDGGRNGHTFTFEWIGQVFNNTFYVTSDDIRLFGVDLSSGTVKMSADLVGAINDPHNALLSCGSYVGNGKIVAVGEHFIHCWALPQQ